MGTDNQFYRQIIPQVRPTNVTKRGVDVASRISKHDAGSKMNRIEDKNGFVTFLGREVATMEKKN